MSEQSADTRTDLDLALPEWDAVGPYHGPCGFCSHPDARHRVVDSIVGMVDAGDSPDLVGKDYGLTMHEVRSLVRVEHERSNTLRAERDRLAGQNAELRATLEYAYRSLARSPMPGDLCVRLASALALSVSSTDEEHTT